MGGIGSGGHRGGQHQSTAEALRRWPAPPDTFTDTERSAWERIGAVCMDAGTVGASDLLAVELTARVLARVDGLFLDEELKVSQLTAYLALLDKQLRALGLCPAARSAVRPLKRESKTVDPMAKFDKR